LGLREELARLAWTRAHGRTNGKRQTKIDKEKEKKRGREREREREGERERERERERKREKKLHRTQGQAGATESHSFSRERCEHDCRRGRRDRMTPSRRTILSDDPLKLFTLLGTSKYREQGAIVRI